MVVCNNDKQDQFHINALSFDHEAFKPMIHILPEKDFPEIVESLQEEGITPSALGSKERRPAPFRFDYLLLRTAIPGRQVSEDLYTPCRKGTAGEIQSADVRVFYYDLTASPRAADMVMDGFRELPEYPDQYYVILKNVRNEIADYLKG